MNSQATAETETSAEKSPLLVEPHQYNLPVPKSELRYNNIIRPELVMDDGTEDAPVFGFKSGLKESLEALQYCHVMTLDICLPGNIWMMLQQSGRDISETISEILTESVELRRNWVNSNDERELMTEALSVNEEEASK